MQEKRPVTSPRTHRRGATWGVLAACIVALGGCAGSYEGGTAYATPRSEPEPAEQANREQQMRTSEEVVDHRTPGAVDRTHADPSHRTSPAPVTSAPELDPASMRPALVESEADARDRDMREVVEGPSTARGRAQDNSAQNERDRSGGASIPFEQNNSASDVDLIAGIRRAIVEDRELSLDAKNVKIVVEDGNVTLRGPVESAAEKARVESIARRAGAARVISLIEVQQ